MLIKFFFVLNFAFLKIATSLNVSQYASATIWERFLADFLKIQDLERCTLSIQVQPGSNFYLSKLLSGQSSRYNIFSLVQIFNKFMWNVQLFLGVTS